jgi:ubiquinone/menaquinone biosynthesis C-methylase UbiE
MGTESIVERVDGPGPAADHGDVDELRRRLHGMWASVAASWGDNAEHVDARAAAVTTRMLELADPQPGERVLELACGAGGAGLAAAARVAPSGEVVLSDVAAEMTAIAGARARALGLAHVSTCELDLEQIAQPDASYDIVLCREGLMLVPDPARAAREIVRVLRPRGRVAVAVWGPRQGNPWLSVVFDALSAQIGTPVPPPGVPGPFSLDDPEGLVGLLSDAGLDDVTVGEVSTPLRAESFEKWWTTRLALTGPLARVVGSLSEADVDELRACLQQAVRPYQTSTALEFPGVSLVASARRA